MMQKLGDIATYINGYAFKPADRGLKGLPIIRIQDLTGNSYDLGFYDGIYPKKIEINNGDILISWSGSLGIFLWNGGKALLNQHIFKVVFDKKDIDKHYFLFAVKEKLNEMSLKTHGATMKHIIKSDFENITISLPDLNEQKRISNMLLKIENLIKMRKNQIQHYDTLTKSLFVEMFGDLKVNNKHWNIVGFKDCATIDTKMVHDFKGYGNYPHIGIDCIEKETGRLLGYRTISEDKVISGKYLFTPNHIIYSKIRPNLNKVAMPEFSGLCSADAYPILVKEGICNREYLGYTLRSRYFLDYILTFSTRTNLPKVNRKQVESFSLPLPPIELQEHFTSLVKNIHKHKFPILD